MEEKAVALCTGKLGGWVDGWVGGLASYRNVEVGLGWEFRVEGRGKEAVVPPGIDLVLDVEDGCVVLLWERWVGGWMDESMVERGGWMNQWWWWVGGWVGGRTWLLLKMES